MGGEKDDIFRRDGEEDTSERIRERESGWGRRFIEFLEEAEAATRESD